MKNQKERGEPGKIYPTLPGSMASHGEHMFCTDAWLTPLHNRMLVMQPNNRLCNRVPQYITYRGTATWLCNWTVWKLPGCATGRSESYLVVQPDGLKATWLCNWTVWKLPGCATGWSESYIPGCAMGRSDSYPVVQPDGLKPIGLCNRMIWQLPGCTTGWSDSYPVVQPDELKASD